MVSKPIEKMHPSNDGILIPDIFRNYENVIAAQSTRKGGVSPMPYHSMNLGSNTADLAQNVEQNKILFANSLGFDVDQVVRAKQIHGTEILIASQGGFYEGYDALITNQKNLLLAVSTADCVPILLYDPIQSAIAAIHAGWKGTKDQLVSKTINKLSQEYHSSPSDILAYIGPCIAECSFEVDKDVAQFFENDFSRFEASKNKYHIDLKKHNHDQLLKVGVLEKNIEISIYDTFISEYLFYSHRRDKGITGRMWTAIGLHES